MATATLVSVEEYLDTAYRPDCDYVEGEVLERNVGELSHGDLQLSIGTWFRTRQIQLGVKATVDVRLQINNKRFRIPDLMVRAGNAPHEEIVITPPVLCIEILSRRDSLNSIWERSQDYLSIGVPTCWILDPIAGRAWMLTRNGLVEAVDGVLRAGDIAMPLAEVLLA